MKYPVLAVGDCLGSWADGRMVTIDPEADIKPFDIVMVVPRVACDGGAPEDSAAMKIFLGRTRRDGETEDRIVLAALHPAETLMIFVSDALVMHQVAETVSVKDLTEDEQDTIRHAQDWNTGIGMSPINPGWRPPMIEMLQMFADCGVEKLTGMNPIKTPMWMFDEDKAKHESQKNFNRGRIGALLGPTAGTIEDIGTAGDIPGQALAVPLAARFAPPLMPLAMFAPPPRTTLRYLFGDDTITAAETRAAERMISFNSFLGLRQMLRYFIEPSISPEHFTRPETLRDAFVPGAGPKR